MDNCDSYINMLSSQSNGSHSVGLDYFLLICLAITALNSRIRVCSGVMLCGYGHRFLNSQLSEEFNNGTL
jgi:hypothetical protein